VLETFDFLAVLAVLGTLFGMVIYTKKWQNTGKKAIRSGETGVQEMYGVYSEQIKDILKLKDNHIKRLNAEIQQYAVEPDQSDENNPAKYEDLKALAKEGGINPLILEMPFIKNLIKKYTKGMSIEEIISTVTELKKFVGNKKLGTNPEEQIKSDPNYF